MHKHHEVLGYVEIVIAVLSLFCVGTFLASAMWGWAVFAILVTILNGFMGIWHLRQAEEYYNGKV